MLEFSENILRNFVLAKILSGKKIYILRECVSNKNDQY